MEWKPQTRAARRAPRSLLQEPRALLREHAQGWRPARLGRLGTPRDFRTVTRRQGGSAAGIQDRPAAATFSIPAQRRAKTPGVLCSLRGGSGVERKPQTRAARRAPRPLWQEPGALLRELAQEWRPPRLGRGTSGPSCRGCLLYPGAEARSESTPPDPCQSREPLDFH